MAVNEEEKWQAKKSTVLERNSFMLNNSLMSDIKFVFPNNTIIPAHKYVLAISSSVFFSMFYSDETESRNTIEITDCEAAFFLNFLRFIYTDEVYFEDVDCAMKVWYIAEKYDVPLLARECVMFIDGNMNPAQSIDVLRHAREVNEKTLETACWEMIDHNAETISKDECFLRIEKEFLLSFIERSSLHIEEIQLFNAINRWAVQRCKENNLACDGPNKVFFNRPISLDEETCYTTELLGASSRSTKYYARCSNTTGITQRASSGHYSRPTNSSRSTDVTFKFCGVLFKDDIPENPYFGLKGHHKFKGYFSLQKPVGCFGVRYKD